MILTVTPGRIPKPCVVGSNPTGGAEYLPLSSSIPPVMCGHLDHPTRPGQEDLPRLHAVDWRLGNKAGLRSALLDTQERCGASCELANGGLGF